MGLSQYELRMLRHIGGEIEVGQGDLFWGLLPKLYAEGLITRNGGQLTRKGQDVLKEMQLIA